MAKGKTDFLAWSEAAEGSIVAVANLISAARSDKANAEQNAEDAYCELLRLADRLFPNNNAKRERDELRAIAGKACSVLSPTYSSHEWPVASAHEWTQCLVHHLLGTVRMAAGLCPGLPGWEMMVKTEGEWAISIRSTECRSGSFFADVTGGEITREQWEEQREKHFAYSPDYNRGFRSMWGRIRWELANFPGVNFGDVLSQLKAERASCGETVPKSLPAPPPATTVISVAIPPDAARKRLETLAARMVTNQERFTVMVDHDGGDVMTGDPEKSLAMENDAKEIVPLLLACGADVSLSGLTFAGRLCEWAHRQLLNRESSITPDPGELNDVTEWQFPFRSIGQAIEAFLSKSGEQIKKTGRKAKPIGDFSDVPDQIQEFKSWLKKNKDYRHNKVAARKAFLRSNPAYDDTNIKRDEQALKQLVLYWQKFFE